RSTQLLAGVPDQAQAKPSFHHRTSQVFSRQRRTLLRFWLHPPCAKVYRGAFLQVGSLPDQRLILHTKEHGHWPQSLNAQNATGLPLAEGRDPERAILSAWQAKRDQT